MMTKTSTGNGSTGNWSTGDRSTGNWSTGNRSTGSWSTGNWSTGNRSTGSWSTGNRSTGNWSTGNGSTGYRSTGNWSISNYSTGHFSTIDYDGFGAFNKPCTPEEWDDSFKPEFICFDLTEWVTTEDMTEAEKQEHKTYKTTGGYLRVYTYKEAWRKAWDSATPEDKELLFKLPNFDADVFKEISGIDVNETAEELTVDEISRRLGYKVKIVE